MVPWLILDSQPLSIFAGTEHPIYLENIRLSFPIALEIPRPIVLIWHPAIYTKRRHVYELTFKNSYFLLNIHTYYSGQ